MSVAQELRTVQANLETRTLELSQAQGTIRILEQGAAIMQATTEQQAAQISEQASVISGHEAAMQALRDAHAVATADLTARVAFLETENGTMKNKLSNPAFAVACVEGEDPKAAGGGGETGDGNGSVKAQYAKLTGAEKTKFFRENKAELVK